MAGPSKVPPAAQPKYSAHFDSWNSSSTGHQRAENRAASSGGWRESRKRKLGEQFGSGRGGGKRVADGVGDGSADFDEQMGGLVSRETRERAGMSVVDMLRGGGVKKSSSKSLSSSTTSTTNEAASIQATVISSTKPEPLKPHPSTSTTQTTGSPAPSPAPTDPPAVKTSTFFANCCVYINGSTHPLISDHKLKHLLVTNGASLALHLGRKAVTHVILGRPSAENVGAGGGLAGGKMQKEIAKTRGKGVVYVGVEWVLESVKEGKRLPEARFSNLKIAAKGQPSVYGMFAKIP